MMRTRAERAALAALGATVIVAGAKLATSATTGSLAVLSQALDSVLDVVALGLAFFGVRIALKPADAEHHYGHAKAENLAAFTQTLFLGVVVLGVAVEAVRRLSSPAQAVAAPGYALAVIAASAVVDLVRVRILLSAAKADDSDALRAGALNFATDVGTAVIALVSLLLVRGGIPRADAFGGFVVAVAVAYAAVKLGKRSVDVLMDRAPSVRSDTIVEAAERAAGVEETRRVRVRSAGKQVFADVTVTAGRTATLERAHDIAEAVEREIEKVMPGTDVIVHVEPAPETGGLIERAQAAASRVPGAREVHNVSIHSLPRDATHGLHVTLHAKVDSGTSLTAAHELSERVEEAVQLELGDNVRVDAHIEPLEATALGRDVTASRADLVRAVERLALEEADVLDCHEVLVTDAGDELAVVAHVRGRGSLPLDRIHGASRRIEKSLHAEHPEVGAVVIHFEPS
jgi:cation diffusion facilitator family transporter